MKSEKPIQKKATILFADLIGSSDVASLTKSKDYSEYLDAFKTTFMTCINKVFNSQSYNKCDKSKPNQELIHYEIKGDEGFLVISGKNVETDISNIFKFALLLKITWLLQNDQSIKRLKENKKPFEIAIGINTGFVNIVDNKLDARKCVPEGYAINLTKRIESESRKANVSGIFISEYTYATYSSIAGEDVLRFEQIGTTTLKGISGSIKLYELIFFNIQDVAEDEEPDIDPTKLLGDWKNFHRKLPEIEKYFNGTLNPWLGNIVCNIIWKRAGDLIRKRELNKALYYLEKCRKIAWKLIESDSQNAVWKIYLSQIIYDYITEMKVVESTNKLLKKDIIKMLKNVVDNNPDDLDAKLYLGKYYLYTKNNECARDLFATILLWKKEYYEAYYFIAASFIDKNKRRAISELRKCRTKFNSRKEGDGDKTIKDTLTDVLFEDLEKDIRDSFPNLF